MLARKIIRTPLNKTYECQGPNAMQFQNKRSFYTRLSKALGDILRTYGNNTDRGQPAPQECRWPCHRQPARKLRQQGAPFRVFDGAHLVTYALFPTQKRRKAPGEIRSLRHSFRPTSARAKHALSQPFVRGTDPQTCSRITHGYGMRRLVI